MVYQQAIDIETVCNLTPRMLTNMKVLGKNQKKLLALVKQKVKCDEDDDERAEL